MVSPISTLMQTRNLAQRGWKHETRGPHRDTMTKKIVRAGEPISWDELNRVVREPQSYQPRLAGFELDVTCQFKVRKAVGSLFEIKIAYGNEPSYFSRLLADVLIITLEDDLGYHVQKKDPTWESRALLWTRPPPYAEILKRTGSGLRVIEMAEEGDALNETLAAHCVAAMLTTRIKQLQGAVLKQILTSGELADDAEDAGDGERAISAMALVGQAASKYIDEITGLLEARKHLLTRCQPIES